MQRRRGQQPGIAAFLLATQLLQVGLNNIPIVTLVTLGINAAIFYGALDGFGSLLAALFSPEQSCISLKHVLYGGDWKRLLLGALVHGDEWHLYYNMVSFLWKGRTLERSLGSPYFAYLLLVFTPLINVVMLLLNYIVGEYIMHDPSYFFQCAVGFSGVIFALKVLTTDMSHPSSMDVVGGWIAVPSRYACWVELILIQMLVPNASFTGHLAGILVGMLYIKGPLRYLMDSMVPSAPQYTYFSGSSGYRVGSRARGSSWSSYGDGSSASHRTRHSGYEEYTGGLSEEEQLLRATQASLSMPNIQPTGRPWSDVSHRTAGHGSSGDSPGHSAIPSAPPGDELEDVRWRRLQRFL